MKLKITLLLLMNFFTLGVMNSKTTETTLWETTYSDGIELNNTVVSTFAEGDILRVYITGLLVAQILKSCTKALQNGLKQQFLQ